MAKAGRRCRVDINLSLKSSLAVKRYRSRFRGLARFLSQNFAEAKLTLKIGSTKVLFQWRLINDQHNAGSRRNHAARCSRYVGRKMRCRFQRQYVNRNGDWNLGHGNRTAQICPTFRGGAGRVKEFREISEAKNASRSFYDGTASRLRLPARQSERVHAASH